LADVKGRKGWEKRTLTTGSLCRFKGAKDFQLKKGSKKSEGARIAATRKFWGQTEKGPGGGGASEAGEKEDTWIGGLSGLSFGVKKPWQQKIGYS